MDQQLGVLGTPGVSFVALVIIGGFAGWIAGMVIEAALKGAGWPANADKVTASLSNLKVDLKGLRGGELQWTKDNHFRTKQYYRVYRWDEAKGAIVRVRDWAAFDVK